MSDEGLNGVYACKIRGDHMRTWIVTAEQTKKILDHSENLSHLKDIKELLTKVITGDGYMHIKTATLVFKLQGAVILGLLGVIIFLLTGSHNGVIGELHK